MKQRLGLKKERRIAEILGCPVSSAWTRGNWDHFVAEVWTAETPKRHLEVNYETGEVGLWASKEPRTILDDYTGEMVTADEFDRRCQCRLIAQNPTAVKVRI